MECRVCGGKFTFGSPHLKARDETKGAKVITGIFEQRKVSRNVEIQGMSATSYYSHLHRFAASFRDWLSVQTAQLLRKEYAEWQAPLRIYTDEIQVSLQRAGDGPRYQLLNIVVTVAAAERRYFVLAAHPAFLPEKPRDPPLDVLLQNESLPIHVRQWDALHHSFASGPTQSAEKMLHALPNLGCGGHFLTSPYVELAHFLVVAKAPVALSEGAYVYGRVKTPVRGGAYSLSRRRPIGARRNWLVSARQGVSGRPKKPDWVQRALEVRANARFVVERI